jgi:hypothetical protein
MILSKIPETIFEIGGTAVGFFCSVLIAFQIHSELQTTGATTLSPLYVSGFLLIFLFWLLYGIKFKRIAMWLTNTLAAVLQGILLAIVLLK